MPLISRAAFVIAERQCYTLIMNTKSIKQAPVINAKPQEIYKIWLTSKLHGKMIGSTAKIQSKVGGKFSIFDGEIVGQTIELKPNKRIVQLWRYNYADWPEEQMSKITLELVLYRGKTRIRFWHSGIPSKYAKDIAQGWKEYYWKPLQEQFAE